MQQRPFKRDYFSAKAARPQKAVETAAPWKPWKNQRTVFPPFPPRLENGKTRGAVFHSSHSFGGGS
jgi:hypothetical protein